jgi:putative membrane protein insertion efficiency factor
MIARLILILIRFYQLAISPWLGPSCRFEPSCSSYAATCVSQHGALKGSLLAMLRVGRCHPLGGFGYDPPPKLVDKIKGT